MLQCSLVQKGTGRPCRSSFRRPWNLKRHILTQHGTTTSTFIVCDQNLQQHVDYHPVTSQSVQGPVANNTQAMLHPPAAAAGTDLMSLQGSCPTNFDQTVSSQHIPTCIRQVDGTAGSGRPLDHPDSLAGLPPCQDPDADSSLKRKRSIDGFDRAARSRNAPPMPAYKVKMSSKIPEQPKGLDWRSISAKRSFEAELDYRLAQWGVSRSHRGTCVLIPEDWKSLDPVDLINIFDLDNCPSEQASRLRYRHDDHSTAFARAMVWFAEWPRSGLQLDNFLGDGIYQPMDASHTCHHSSCIVHVTYDPAHVNQEDRMRCCELSRDLRREGKDIPEFCSDHSPPCLLQHAALTTNEAFCIQFDVLRQARGLVNTQKFQRPRRHRFSTFEGGLPCRFPAIEVDTPNLIIDPPASRKKIGRPEMFCMFCKRIRAFDSVAGYWGHLVHKHDGIDISVRLDEIRRTAADWKVYWDQQCDGGKRGHVTKQRLEQVVREDFCWDVVLAWELR